MGYRDQILNKIILNCYRNGIKKKRKWIKIEKNHPVFNITCLSIISILV